MAARYQDKFFNEAELSKLSEYLEETEDVAGSKRKTSTARGEKL